MKLYPAFILVCITLNCLFDSTFAQGRGIPIFSRRRPRPGQENPHGSSPSQSRLPESHDTSQRRNRNRFQTRNRKPIQSQNQDQLQPWNRDSFQPSNQDRFQPRGRDRFQSRHRDSFQTRDQDPFQARDQKPFQSRDQDPFQPRDRNPFQQRNRDRLQQWFHDPFESRNQGPFHTWDQEPLRPRDRDPFRPRGRNPLQPQPILQLPRLQTVPNRNQGTRLQRVSKPLLSRQNFRVASVQVEPFLFRNGSGYIPDLLEEMSRVGGFTYQITQYSQAILGIWNLLIEKVANKEYDMAAGPITITRFRENFVDFTQAISRHKPHILVKSVDADVIAFADSLANSPGGITVGTLEDSAVLDHFQNSESPVLQQLYTSLRANQSLLAHTVDDGLRKVRDGNYAFFVDGPIAEYLREQDPCELSAIPYGRDYITYGLAIRKDLASAVKSTLDDAIYQMGRNGFLVQLKNKYFNTDMQCEDYYEDLI